MPLDIIHQPERDLTTFVAKGYPSVAEILRTYREVKENYGLTKHSLWDGREASFTHFARHDLAMLDHFLALIQNNCAQRVGGRSALLFGNTRDAGLFWDFAKLNYRLPQRRQVVLSLEAALAWAEKGIAPRNHSNIPW
ncbi:MAG: hypothetical protein KKC30_01700 [Proteobacteria bacterium]|nr:hypothetical protein [Pseudomonadota bacterium]MBU4275435.1 hypothetical protein [Pseudomonadota bacterium]MBU4382712.1 hypothetical protein [Pseudomonadota bacterium]MBU4605647.1 hypothetical protein [Pseudomonadota bacterium]MCG2765227.1 hypothetical protein [Desulfarculaceae bacterium]